MGIFDIFKNKNVRVDEIIGPIRVEDDDSDQMKHYILLINVALRTAKNINEFKTHLATLKLPKVMPAQNAPVLKSIDELDAFKLLSTFVTIKSIINEIHIKIKNLTPVPHIFKELLEDPSVSEKNKQNLIEMHHITKKTKFQDSHRAEFPKNKKKIKKIKNMYNQEWKNFKTSTSSREKFIHNVFYELEHPYASELVSQIYEYNDFFFEVYLRMLVRGSKNANAAIDESVPNWPLLFQIEVDENL